MLTCPTCGKFRRVLYQVRDDGHYLCRFCARKSILASGPSDLIIAKYEQEGVYDGLSELHMRLNVLPKDDDYVRKENEEILQKFWYAYI